jgi:hypothetical protein
MPTARIFSTDRILVDCSAGLVATMTVSRRDRPNSCLPWPLTLGFGSLFHWRKREETQRGSSEICEGLGGTPAVIGVAIMIAVEEFGSDFSQIATPDRLTTQRTRRLLAGRPVIHTHEFHVAPPSAKQKLRRDRRRNC